MTHPLLFNPFHASQEQRPERAEQVRRHAALPRERRRSAAIAASDDIISKATVQWSNEQQEWELADTFAKPAHCSTCNMACEIVWLPLN